MKGGSILMLAFGMLVMLSACHDELKYEEGVPGGDVEVEGDCLVFSMKLDRDMDSRADDVLGDYTIVGSSDLTKYDSYIDTQDKFRVFFFTKDGDFLFGATDRVVGSYESTDNAYSYWYVRIPMTMIVDRENQEYDIDKIKNYLKTNPFKIAVLANWPNAGEKVNPADWDDSEGTPSGTENPSSTLKGHPQWNWSNSILNKDASASDIRNINDLHHVYNDLYYGNETLTSDGTSRKGTYERFMAHVTTGDEPGYYMGEPTDWVKMRDVDKGWKYSYDLSTEVPSFDSKVTANQWIRANCTPEVKLNHDKEIYRHYQHMWFLWNFDASYKYGKWLSEHADATKEEKKAEAKDCYGKNWDWNDGSPASVTNPWGVEWYDRNGKILYEWMKNSIEKNAAIGSKTIDIGESNNDVFFKYISKGDAPAYGKEVNGNYGVQLPNIGSTRVNSSSTGVINFRARTSGTLRVKWSSLDGTPSSLAVQRGDREDANSAQRIHTGYSNTTPTDWINPADNLHYEDIPVEGNSQPMYIYCTQGKAVVYSIEFIRGRYLYDTDREGVMPGIDQAIPMYGVQDYVAIGDWQRGTTFNLPGTVKLLRALARVEVYIPVSFGEPRHVYMRNLNRAARCEPMDVHTRTDLVWNNLVVERDADNNLTFNHSHNNEYCEWFRIQQYGPSYNPSRSSNEYTNWLSWFYGSWKFNQNDYEPIHWKSSDGSAKYVWNYDRGYYIPAGGSLGGWNESAFGYSSELQPPHIFNPYIYRSSFCRFISAGIDGGNYYKYILYLPEKYIDDPSVVGKSDSTPYVPHIEYRFTPKTVAYSDLGSEDLPSPTDDDPYSNTEYNLDDNDCYRIYFTNYGYDSNGGASLTEVNDYLKNNRNLRELYDDYEKNAEYLKYHWPIMRNHVYKFYVGGDGPQNPEIHVEVSDWSHRKAVVVW